MCETRVTVLFPFSKFVLYSKKVFNRINVLFQTATGLEEREAFEATNQRSLTCILVIMGNYFDFFSFFFFW